MGKENLIPGNNNFNTTQQYPVISIEIWRISRREIRSARISQWFEKVKSLSGGSKAEVTLRSLYPQNNFTPSSPARAASAAPAAPCQLGRE
jgi:hypothetical protein